MSDDIHQALTAANLAPGEISNLKRLSGGASQETWSFDADGKGFILRRAPHDVVSENAIGLPAEAALLKAAQPAGAFIPAVLHVFDGPPVNKGYVMLRIEGETIARKILRDDEFAEVRPKLAHQCGEALAAIHALDAAKLPALPTVTFTDQIKRYEDIYRSFDAPRPVFELAFRWLKDNVPASKRTTLVHGDFRNGNLMIGPDGLRAVLDWELAHFGDPLEDIAWICTPSWRFGEIDKPVGGFGQLDDLIAGYGRAVTHDELKPWLLFAPLKWGIMCLIMYRAFESGLDRSVERAAIGRRASETEMDLVMMLESL